MRKKGWKTFALVAGVHFSGVGVASAVYIYDVDNWLMSAALFVVSAVVFTICGMIIEEMVQL